MKFRAVINIVTVALLAMFFAMPTAAQVVMHEEEHPFNSDSIRRELDKSPYFTLYKDNYFIGGTTIGKPITSQNSDVKFQISISQRLTKSTLPFKTYLFLMYSQKTFWNVFEESLPMRDLNFNPGFGLTKYLISKDRLMGKLTLLVEHESNGRDSIWSRSWNKISLAGNLYVTPQIMLHGKVWIPIIDGENNRDICRYSGIFQVGIQYQSKNKRFGAAATFVRRARWSLFSYNTILELNYRIFRRENQFLFLQYYNGYGENLLDYNKFHSRLRIGLVIKPKFFSEF